VKSDLIRFDPNTFNSMTGRIWIIWIRNDVWTPKGKLKSDWCCDHPSQQIDWNWDGWL